MADQTGVTPSLKKFLCQPESWLLVIPLGLVVVVVLHLTGVAFR